MLEEHALNVVREEKSKSSAGRVLEGAASDQIPNMEEDDLLTIVEAESIESNNCRNGAAAEPQSRDRLTAAYHHDGAMGTGSKFLFSLQAI
jgi:hypothetical protein